MPKITITVVDTTGNRSEEATVPDDAEIGRIITKLVELMDLPPVDPQGARISYKFHHKSSGRQLADNQTLAQAEVHEGDVLRLVPEITAGQARR